MPRWVRAEPKIATAGPSSASRPNPSTNSDWIRSTRHGIGVHPVGGTAPVEQPLVSSGRRYLLAAQRHGSLATDPSVRLGIHAHRVLRVVTGLT